MFQRPHIKELKSRIREARKHIQVIMGPRQVGKTTLVNQFQKNFNPEKIILVGKNGLSVEEFLMLNPLSLF